MGVAATLPELSEWTIITHVHNDWGILYFIFWRSTTDFVLYLICVYLPQDWTEINWQWNGAGLVISQQECFKSYPLSLQSWDHAINFIPRMFWLFYSAGLKTLKDL